MFEAQKAFMDRVGYSEPDRYEKTVLALQVEIGECANEERSWKFWSKKQKPRTWALRWDLNPERNEEYNPLLEEYVDGFHLTLQLGIELDMVEIICKTNIIPSKKENTTKQFNYLYAIASRLNKATVPSAYRRGVYLLLFEAYVGLGEMLGFTWEQIEEAYYMKNKVNHARQENGY
jgi:dimeric dUTPase (all-alpha-NTP-PPase superfamily)